MQQSYSTISYGHHIKVLETSTPHVNQSQDSFLCYEETSIWIPFSSPSKQVAIFAMGHKGGVGNDALTPSNRPQRPALLNEYERL